MRVFADFQNADARGRLRLTTVGTLKDLSQQGVTLTDGLALTVYEPDELEADGTVQWSEDEQLWVADIGPVRHLDVK